MSGPSEGFTSVLLVGFMGSGKTRVGRALAERLGWTFVDFDDEIEHRTGRTVSRIFADEGEEVFRRLETELGERFVGRPRTVLAPGGGWGAVRGRLDDLPPDVLSVWLQVDADTAVERARRDGPSRPLLATDDPLATARELLERRRGAYASARLHVDTVGTSPDAVVSAIVGALESAREGTSS